jgi:SAM-dependent methyltransferase
MSCYVHPKAAPDPSAGEHDRGLELNDEAAVGYLRWVAGMMIPYLGESALEVGSGHGGIAEQLAGGRRLVATDISDACLSILRSRFVGWPNVEVRRMDLRHLDIEENFTSIVIVNVLEHIYDDVGALRTLSRCLDRGGHCLIYVPALNWLYGEHDRDIGHYRRYSRRRLAAVVADAGLRPVKLHYVNMLGIPAWIAFSSRWLDRGNSAHVSRSLRLWDQVGVPLTSLIERRVHPPIGLNLFCAACKE